MSKEDPKTSAIPLFPLPDVVHFPGTELKLHIFEPRYRQLIRDLLELEPDARWIGMVLMRPKDEEEPAAGNFFTSGTAGRLVDVEYLPDGRSNILLRGEFRFEVQHELEGKPYREAVVERVSEPSVNESDPSIRRVRESLTELVGTLSHELGEDFPVSPDDISGPTGQLPFEHLVNRIAAEIDLPAMAKHGLLVSTLPQRAISLVGILGGRSQAIELLRPFRHLAGNPEHN